MTTVRSVSVFLSVSVSLSDYGVVTAARSVSICLSRSVSFSLGLSVSVCLSVCLSGLLVYEEVFTEEYGMGKRDCHVWLSGRWSTESKCFRIRGCCFSGGGGGGGGDNHVIHS